MRDFYRLGQSDFPWSDVCADVPYTNLTASFVLEGGSFRVTDFGTSNHTPEDYLDRVVGFALHTTDGCAPGEVKAVPLDELDAIVAAVRKAQSTHYRNIAAMEHMDKIRAGAYVYFTFLRPFAEIAGCADDLDWTRAPRPARRGRRAHRRHGRRQRRAARRRRTAADYYPQYPT